MKLTRKERRLLKPYSLTFMFNNFERRLKKEAEKLQWTGNHNSTNLIKKLL